jgi:hypothetical protein
MTVSNTGPMITPMRPKAERPPITPTDSASVDTGAWRQISRGRIRFPEADTPAPRINWKIVEPNWKVEAKTIAGTQTRASPPTDNSARSAARTAGRRAGRHDRYLQGNGPRRQADASLQPTHQAAMHRC